MPACAHVYVLADGGSLRSRHRAFLVALVGKMLMSRWDRDPKEHSTYYPQVSHFITKHLD